MRLLEFSHTDSDADQQETAHIAARIKDRPGIPSPRPRFTLPGRPPARLLLMPGSSRSRAAAYSCRRNAAQSTSKTCNSALPYWKNASGSRVETAQASTPDLEELKQRLLKLERNINSELWAAKQREYTLLEMLARPSPGARIAAGIARFRSHHLPAIGRCSGRGGPRVVAGQPAGLVAGFCPGLAGIPRQCAELDRAKIKTKPCPQPVGANAGQRASGRPCPA